MTAQRTFPGPWQGADGWWGLSNCSYTLGNRAERKAQSEKDKGGLCPPVLKGAATLPQENTPLGQAGLKTW